MTTQRYVWIIEHWWDRDDRWSATVGIALTRDAARVRLNQWRERNPDDRFRLARYEATHP